MTKENLYDLARAFDELKIFKSTLELDALDYLKVEETIKYDLDNSIISHNINDTTTYPQITIKIDRVYIRFICTNTTLK